MDGVYLKPFKFFKSVIFSIGTCKAVSTHHYAMVHLLFENTISMLE